MGVGVACGGIYKIATYGIIRGVSPFNMFFNSVRCSFDDKSSGYVYQISALWCKETNHLCQNMTQDTWV